MAVEPKLMTAEELLRLPSDGQRHELVRGKLRTMSPPGFEHGGLTIAFGGSLDRHVRMHRLGQVVGEVGFQL
ncbi:MAG: Uma2 family endonuclease, partial [Chloroflexi bacterium]|nr:Uma2 family endonuclease [Chloroflexota bacterium]